MSNLPKLLECLDGETEPERVPQQLEYAPDPLKHNFVCEASTRAVACQRDVFPPTTDCATAHVGEFQKLHQGELQSSDELGRPSGVAFTKDDRYSYNDYCAVSTAVDEVSRQSFRSTKCTHVMTGVGVPADCFWKSCGVDRNRPVPPTRPDVLHESVSPGPFCNQFIDVSDIRNQLTLTLGGDQESQSICVCPHCVTAAHVLANETIHWEMTYPRVHSGCTQSESTCFCTKCNHLRDQCLYMTGGNTAATSYTDSKHQIGAPRESSPINFLPEEIYTRRDIYMSRLNVRHGCDGSIAEFGHVRDMGLSLVKNCNGVVPSHCESVPVGMPEPQPAAGQTNSGHIQHCSAPHRFPANVCTCKSDCDYPVNFWSSFSHILLPSPDKVDEYSVGFRPNQEAVQMEGGSCCIDTDQRAKEMEELRLFAQSFKHRRMKLGITQAEVGNSLGSLDLYGFGSLSQSTICRFESLSLSHNNMLVLKPILQTWLRQIEQLGRVPDRNGDGGGGDGGPPNSIEGGLSETKTRRTSITDVEKSVLEAYFNSQPKPSGEELCRIANRVQLKKSVVRVWFCNQRQKQKRIQFSHRNQKAGHTGHPAKAST